MRCKYCDIEIVLTNGIWWQAHTTYSLCGYSVSGIHEPFEPEAAQPDYCKCDWPYEGCRPVDKPRRCERCKKLINVVAGPKITNLVADNGPRVDTQRVPPAHYFCAECGKTLEPCYHFSRLGPTTQATEARPISPGELLKKISWPIVREDPGPDVDYSDSDGEAVAQKVEQSDVEPQKVCIHCKNTKVVEVSDESVMACPYCVACDWGCSKTMYCVSCKIHTPKPKPEAGSTRPEMPPAFVKSLVSIWKSFKEENPSLILGEWGHELEDAIDDLNERWYAYGFVAASVQQDPLSAEAELLYRKDCGDLAIKCSSCSSQIAYSVRPFFCSQCGASFVAPTHQPAAPRTHPSRPYKEGLFERLKDPVYAAHYTAECIKLGIEARTQPSPRTPACPKCGSEKLEFHLGSDLVGWLGAMTCNGCGLGKDEVFDIEDWTDFAQFFTALPEATKEEK